jgi:uncharacterized protein YjbJ (UPF0337 family)
MGSTFAQQFIKLMRSGFPPLRWCARLRDLSMLVSARHFFRRGPKDFRGKKAPSQAKYALQRNRPKAPRVDFQSRRKQEFCMDREHIKGTADKTKGTIKDAAGKLTGDKELQTEGKVDKAKGSAHNVAGDLKDAVGKSKE